MKHLPFFFSLALLSAACGDDRTILVPASSTQPTQPAKDGGGSGTTSELSATCKEYLSCCEEVAAQYPQLAANCDSVKTSLEDAEKKGTSTESYESACKSGVQGFQQVGYCK